MSNNDVVIEAWNTVLFDKFVRFKHLLVAGLAGHSDEILSRKLYPEGARVPRRRLRKVRYGHLHRSRPR